MILTEYWNATARNMDNQTVQLGVYDRTISHKELRKILVQLYPYPSHLISITHRNFAGYSLDEVKERLAIKMRGLRRKADTMEKLL